ncbi:MAG: PAS domain S-box protein, partial [Acidobacteriota bacterium]
PPQIAARGMSSAIVVPIAGGDEGAYGVLAVYSRHRNHFTGEDVNFLRACANVVAECLHRENVESALRERARQQAAIADLAQRILVSPSLDATIAASELVMSTLDVEYASFMRLLPDGRQFVMVEGNRWSMTSGDRMAVEGTQAGCSIESNETIVVDDYRLDSRFRPETNFLPHGILSGVTVPVVGKKTRFGVLTAHSPSVRRFLQSEVRFIKAAADLLAEGLERAETEGALRESRARYRDVVEGAPAIIATFFPDRTILALNRAFEEITGWTVAEWVGKDFADLIAPEHQQKARQFFSAIVAGNPVAPEELHLRTKRDEIRLLQISAAPHSTDGQVVEIYAFGHDVTDRRLAESERLRIARELELILDAAGEGIYGVGIDGRCTMINRAAASILGYTAEELLGAQVHELIHSHPRSSPDGTCQVAESIRTGQRIRVSDDAFVAKDGREIPVEYSASPIFDEGVARGAVVCFADTSARQKLEGQLEQARRLTSLGKLAATVAHEFNNVLMGISPFADLMHRETEGTNQRLFNSTTHIQNALKRGKRITEEILRFTNPSEPALAAFDVAGWLHSIEHEIRNVIGEAFAVEVRTPSESLSALGDASQLHQILTNLALNARDAMPMGGELTLVARHPSPGETFGFGILENPESYAQISVRDSGSGIPPAVVPHIFEPLFTTKKAGTGLGLAVTHQVVKRHRGEIFVESAVGRGTTFHLFIPLGQQQDIPADVQHFAHPELNSRTILLVEDDPIVAAGLEAALESEGLTVHHVATGREAIDALRSMRVDGAIIDVGLPDMEGTLVYELGVEHAAIPVIFSTGHADKSKIAKYLVNPNVAYLLKPYSIDVLLETLVAILPA